MSPFDADEMMGWIEQIVAHGPEAAGDRRGPRRRGRPRRQARRVRLRERPPRADPDPDVGSDRCLAGVLGATGSVERRAGGLPDPARGVHARGGRRGAVALRPVARATPRARPGEGRSSSPRSASRRSTRSSCSGSPGAVRPRRHAPARRPPRDVGPPRLAPLPRGRARGRGRVRRHPQGPAGRVVPDVRTRTDSARTTSPTSRSRASGSAGTRASALQRLAESGQQRARLVVGRASARG